eukprot:scaffold3111_cov332-Prasinococcus_capsulatus_cf.AAC.14
MTSCSTTRSRRAAMSLTGPAALPSPTARAVPPQPPALPPSRGAASPASPGSAAASDFSAAATAASSFCRHS